MLRKVIAAAASVALLVNTSMIISAKSTYAEGSASTETEVNFVSAKANAEETEETVETTVVSSTTIDETTTTEAETTSLEDVGAAIREGLEVKIRDVVTFYRMVRLYDSDGNMYYPESGTMVLIVGIDDTNQRFRVQSPNVTPYGEFATYLLYSDATKATLISHDGYIIGDVDCDGCINAKDFTFMKRGLLYGKWEDKMMEFLADWDGDSDVTIKDLILMQRWLLGIK